MRFNIIIAIRNLIIPLLFPALNLPVVNAGPVAYGVCQAGCAAVVTACYSAAGFAWGVTITNPPAVILACNSAFGTCYAACAAVALAPTP